MNLAQVLLSTAEKFREKTAIVFEDKAYTFHDIDLGIRRSAAMLNALGVKPGDRVAIQVPKSMDFIFLHLANISNGGITLPLNTGYKSDEIKYFIEDSQSSLYITDEKNYLKRKRIIESLPDLLCMVIDATPNGTLNYPAELAKVADHPRGTIFPSQSDDVAIICYTSGTTGLPKGAMNTHANLIENMLSLKTAWQWRQNDVLLHVLPLFHVHGLVVALHGALNAGSTMIMHEKFDPKRVWKTIEDAKCSMFMGVPTMYYRLLREWETLTSKPNTQSMRVFISGSAPLSDKVFKQFSDRIGTPILERYGMTETGMNTSNPIDPKGRVPGSVGFPLPGVEVRIADQSGRDVTAGDVGEVYVRGDNVFKGYWRNPEKTAESFDGSWFKTGDMGRQDPDDNMRLCLSGRAKELIISGGYNVYPKEIENVVDQFEGVGESAVVGLPDEDFGERVTAVVVPKTPDLSPDADQIISFCKERLAGYKCPKNVIFRSELPRNAMGKVQKHLLVKEYS